MVAIVFPIGCSSARYGHLKNLPSPLSSTVVGPGDVFTINVVGEKDLPLEYRVQPDGTIDFPYIGRLLVSGLQPQEIVDLIKEKLKENKILTSPQVSLFVKQYNSKRVSVIGQVVRPGNIPWIEGMKIVDALSQAGWFTPLADSSRVIITRLTEKGTVTVVISVDAITDGAQTDIPLQAGDTIKVIARPF
ncbi:hypothetical protein BCY86_06080 [Pajaroellobacter abortibovis]|uniref:Uncharacterized protein n=2 Tax=Pajaroellobacter abortibovis TaxID=1882918 RepID=A0A1L6MZD5_9BACT|nr:hypothetical protein BCY86_06080 [Pajaroellobacter abortibovis]